MLKPRPPRTPFNWQQATYSYLDAVLTSLLSIVRILGLFGIIAHSDFLSFFVSDLNQQAIFRVAFANVNPLLLLILAMGMVELFIDGLRPRSFEEFAAGELDAARTFARHGWALLPIEDGHGYIALSPDGAQHHLSDWENVECRLAEIQRAAAA